MDWREVMAWKEFGRSLPLLGYYVQQLCDSSHETKDRFSGPDTETKQECQLRHHDDHYDI